MTNVAVTAWSRRELTSQVYNLAIDRSTPAAADVKLSALHLTEGTAISFDPLVFWYWVTDVGESVESLTLTASPAQTGASVMVDPTDADPDLEGHQIAFTGANMRVTVTVTSTDGSATRTYTVSLHRKLEWADFELGWVHGCGLRSDGRIICGAETDGQGLLYSDSSHVPSAPEHNVYRDVHVGKHESCGTLVNNTLHCWSGGRQLSSQLGRQTTRLFLMGSQLLAVVGRYGPLSVGRGAGTGPGPVASGSGRGLHLCLRTQPRQRDCLLELAQRGPSRHRQESSSMSPQEDTRSYVASGQTTIPCCVGHMETGHRGRKRCRPVSTPS